MTAQNYTPIHHLVDQHKKQKQAAVSLPREVEPTRSVNTDVLQETKLPADTERFLAELDKEPDVAPEVQPYVEVKPKKVEVAPDLKKAGLQPATPSVSTSYQNIPLPMSDEKIEEGLHQPVTTSWRWLAELAIYMLGQAKLGLKVVHGKVVRVIRF